ncbi:MAG: putative RNA-binding protein eif1AD [Geoglossum simile]|nr:MAG: putative RNA-binding protein eif1AD [Geoglossum simile]
MSLLVKADFHPVAKIPSPKPTRTWDITKTGALSTFAFSRNGRKTLTTVQGVPKKFDQKKVLKALKKKFACNGTIVKDTEYGEVIQLQGDHRVDVKLFLITDLECDEKIIKVRVRRESPFLLFIDML